MIINMKIKAIMGLFKSKGKGVSVRRMFSDPYSVTYVPELSVREMLLEPQPTVHGQCVVLKKEVGTNTPIIDRDNLHAVLMEHLGPRLSPDLSNLSKYYPDLFDAISDALPVDNVESSRAVAKVIDIALNMKKQKTYSVDRESKLGTYTLKLVHAVNNIANNEGLLDANLTDNDRGSILNLAFLDKEVLALAHRSRLERIMQKHAYMHVAFFAIFRLSDSSSSRAGVLEAVWEFRQQSSALYAAAQSVGLGGAYAEAFAVNEMFVIEIANMMPVVSPSFHDMVSSFDLKTILKDAA